MQSKFAGDFGYWFPAEGAPRIALGRKNYLFAGSHHGAEQAAAIYTLVANAKLQQVEPFVYLSDVIKRISDHPYKVSLR
ncbi:hypothetical protein JXA02_03130 [candidate division KSB1 bacterium]|nr:hypothetical protein [candidate division KSB1 bacterium]RQW09776.1 MAG: hypothetical protein EH222_03475 [candidate division KSB1 bacterium]